jgi:hypothetical protein
MILRSSYDDLYFDNVNPKFTDYHKYFILKGGRNIKKKSLKNHKLLKSLKIKNRKRSLKGGVIYGKGKYRFDFMVDTDDNMTKIFIGNKINCFTGLIYPENKTELIIQGFAFNKYCNVEQNLNSGKDTKIMFNTIIDFIRVNYQKVKKVILTDNANTYCYSEITKYRERISLYHLYLLKYGKGYYMQNFGFKISYNDDIIIHKNNIRNYLKFILNYNDFKIFLTFGANKKYKQLLDELKTFFTINDELKQELHFKDISRKLKENKYDCYFIYELIDYFKLKCKIRDLRYDTYQLSL